VPGHRPGALRAHLVGSKRGEPLQVGQPDGAPAQLLADRSALLPSPQTLQLGAQRGQLLAQRGGFRVDFGGELGYEFAAALAREPAVLVGYGLGVPDKRGELADPVPCACSGPFRLGAPLFPLVPGPGFRGRAGVCFFQVITVALRTAVVREGQQRPGNGTRRCSA
jgi:hypothetical protein